MRLTRIAALCSMLFSIPAASSAATFAGEFWDHDATLLNLSAADAVIASRPADATFTLDLIDVPLGPNATVPDATPLSTFLGIDASLLNGFGGTSIEESVFRFTGFLNLAAGDQTFAVGSDDGFRLTIDGSVVSSFANQRAFAVTEVTADPGTGVVPFELVYFENQGVTGVEFLIDGVLAQPAAIPLPATFLLLVSAMGAMTLGLRRRTRG